MKRGTARLSNIFLRHLSPATRSAARTWADLEPTLQHGLAAGRASWPMINLEPREFLCFVAERLPAQLGNAEELRGLYWTDLYLTCGCSKGLPEAVAAFERYAMADVQRALTAMGLEPELIEEAKQRSRMRLLVGEDGEPPKIGQYQGRGVLLSWVRVSSVREARMSQRSTKRTVPTDDDFLDQIPSPDDDQELLTLKRLYRSEFRQAFQAALATLEGEERIVLRYHSLDKLSIDDIAAVFGVHRATVARWLVNIRTALLERTRTGMQQRLRVSEGELQSIMRLIESKLEASIHHFLAEQGE